jgi:hypothetical protein
VTGDVLSNCAPGPFPDSGLHAADPPPLPGAQPVTAAQMAALDAYWAAKTPDQERLAYRQMLASGLPDGYSFEDMGINQDVRRYRWLRENPAFETEAFLGGLTPEEFDQAVDGAMRDG